MTLLLIAYFATLWVAVLLRIDRFPLTWAPMYSIYRQQEGDELPVVLKDKKKLVHSAWRATHRDGSSSWLGGADLNVPKRSMWRLAYERSYQKGPPKHAQMNVDAGTLDRWLWGMEPGEPYVRVDWHRRLLESVNETLGLRPDDPRFIIELAISSEMLFFDKTTLELRRRSPRDVEIAWNPAWSQSP